LTAQKKDISDPEVVAEFAALVGDELHLDYLYVLTVSDVRATNPSLWNSWKAALFHELYEQTRRALRRGLANPLDPDELVADTRLRARDLLRDDAAPPAEEIERVWERLPSEYFQRSQPAEVAWHTRVLAEVREGSRPLVALGQPDGLGSTCIL